MRKVLSFSFLTFAALVNLPAMAAQTSPGLNCVAANGANVAVGADGAIQNNDMGALNVSCPLANTLSANASVTPSVIVNDGTNVGIVSCHATAYSGGIAGTTVTGATVSTTAADLGKKKITLGAITVTAPGGSVFITCTLPAGGMMGGGGGGGTPSSVISYSTN